ncbi:MAG: uroporphyrinogen decarboxylase family protein, partial [Atribacterota bacterium]
YEFIPDFIEMGVDILNPIQPRARNMEPWRLKKEFGMDLTFMGGLDIQELLPRGSVEDVRRGVKELIKAYAPGGGFIFATSHNIEPDTPVENIVAMFEAALEYGKYPIEF